MKGEIIRGPGGSGSNIKGVPMLEVLGARRAWCEVLLRRKSVFMSSLSRWLLEKKVALDAVMGVLGVILLA